MKTKLSQYWKTYVLFVPAFLLMFFAIVSCSKKPEPVLPHKENSSGVISGVNPYEYPVDGNNNLAALGDKKFSDPFKR